MFPSDQKYLELDDKEKIQKTEDFFSSIGAKKDRIAKESKELEEKIDEALAMEDTNKTERFLELLHDSHYEECRMFSYDFSCLRLFDMAAQMEKQSNKWFSVEGQTSFMDMKWSYQGLVFYLRRIEFDFPLEEQRELFTFMEQHRLSFYYLYCVFTSPVIADKCKIALGLADLLQREGNVLWADFYTEWVETNYAQNEGMLMTLACRYLELGNVAKAINTLEKIVNPNQEIKNMIETLKGR